MIKGKITYDSPLERDKIKTILINLGILKIDCKQSKRGINYIQFIYGTEKKD